jgi:tRNA (Thr-GGU) A37 N-methylase
MIKTIKFKQIGIIRTPYIDNAPYQSIKEGKGEFRIVVDSKYTKGLLKLGSFIMNINIKGKPEGE